MASEPVPPAVRIPRGDERYPAALSLHLGDQAPVAITAIGDLAILSRNILALFCSVRCPGEVIMQTYDLARALRDAGVTVIGGFHSAMEQECLALLLRGAHPVIVCPARGIAGMRVPRAWRAPLATGRLLLLSPFATEQRRATADLARARNLVVAALAGAIMIAHAAPGSKTERLAAELACWGKPLFTLNNPANAHLVALGAQALAPADVRDSVRFG